MSAGSERGRGSAAVLSTSKQHRKQKHKQHTHAFVDARPVVKRPARAVLVAGRVGLDALGALLCVCGGVGGGGVRV